MEKSGAAPRLALEKIESILAFKCSSDLKTARKIGHAIQRVCWAMCFYVARDFFLISFLLAIECVDRDAFKSICKFTTPLFFFISMRLKFQVSLQSCPTGQRDGVGLNHLRRIRLITTMHTAENVNYRMRNAT